MSRNTINSSNKSPVNIKRQLICRLYNPVISFIYKKRNNANQIQSNLKDIGQIKSKQKSEAGAISDHLVTLYIESIKVQPQLIVELGVRGGTSTFVFKKVARKKHSTIVSVDIEDCPGIVDYDKCYFVKQDDVEFSATFNQWCAERDICPKIDILFIDTSHNYEHTKKEIESWFPFLSEKSKVFFHDTNMGKTYRRKDNSIGFGWDNNRGVIRAIEEYFDSSFDETRPFTVVEKKWVIEHYPYSSGFTILTRI